MEKYSAYRDPGTGIQPFLPPVPPQATKSIVVTLLRPFNLIIGTVRLSLVIILGVLYAILVNCFCLPLLAVPPLFHSSTNVVTALLSRLCLLVLGFVWINVETVSRKRGRALPTNAPWRPKSGDIIVSNWLSYVEVLWLAFRFNPTFVLPITPPMRKSPTAPPSSRSTPHRRAGTGTAALSQPLPKSTVERVPILGFRTVSLLEMLNVTGHVPPYRRDHGVESARSIEEIRSTSLKPVVVFPECTTSNGRGLLRFADVFSNMQVPVKGYNVFIMSVRIGPPSPLSPTISSSVPCRFGPLNPLPHMFTLASAILPHNLSIRLLALSDGPSSRGFLVSNVIPSVLGESTDVLSEICATLVGEIGRMKRVGLGWEDKGNFSDLYRAKTR